MAGKASGKREGRSVSTVLDDELYAALEQLAGRNDRTVAAEVRRAVRAHLEAQGRRVVVTSTLPGVTATGGVS